MNLPGNIFSVDQGINQKKDKKNCINAHSTLLQKFSILFSSLELEFQIYLAKR